jgi:hypothetical protein
LVYDRRRPNAASAGGVRGRSEDDVNVHTNIGSNG